MPLFVTEIWPSRNALLLFGSSHDRVPGMKFAYISLPYSSAFIVSALSITTLLSLSTSLPPKAQTSQLHHRPSPVALPSAMPPGVPFSFTALSIFRKLSVSFGKLSNAADFSTLSR
jgi:hypothetical protein